MIFGSLDFVYIPSKDVDKDLQYYVETLGAEKIFNINDMGTQVAMMKLGDGPRLLLAGHLEGEVPILIYRVENLKKAMDQLAAPVDLENATHSPQAPKWKKGQEVEIPHGPCCTFEASGGQRFAIYELVRPEADKFLMRGK
jgi:hypothetical protein